MLERPLPAIAHGREDRRQARLACCPLVQDAGLIRQFRPRAGYAAEMRPLLGRRSIRCQVATLRGQSQARQRIFLDVT